MHFVEPQFPPHPQCHRAVCASCHASRDERVLNTGIEADLGQDGFYAFVYLCESCVTEWGREFGQMDVAQVEALRAELADAKAEASDLAQRLEAFSQLNDLIVKHTPVLSDIPADFVRVEPKKKVAAK